MPPVILREVSEAELVGLLLSPLRGVEPPPRSMAAQAIQQEVDDVLAGWLLARSVLLDEKDGGSG
jgi:hypothetical protein